MFWEWAFCVCLSMGTVCSISNMSKKTSIADKILYMLMGTAEFMVAVMYIFKMMITAIGGL